MSKTSRMNKAKEARAKAQDKQAPLNGKVENDFNKQGGERPTQKNEGQRTPQSRSDRESHVGSHNQSQSRRGGPGSGEGGWNG
jgi:hypothetical protein